MLYIQLYYMSYSYCIIHIVFTIGMVWYGCCCHYYRYDYDHDDFEYY